MYKAGEALRSKMIRYSHRDFNVLDHLVDFSKLWCRTKCKRFPLRRSPTILIFVLISTILIVFLLESYKLTPDASSSIKIKTVETKMKSQTKSLQQKVIEMEIMELQNIKKRFNKIQDDIYENLQQRKFNRTDILKAHRKQNLPKLPLTKYYKGDEYIEFHRTDARAEGDFYCQGSVYADFCSFNVQRLSEAMSLCNRMKICKGFVYFTMVNEDGSFHAYFKSNISRIQSSLRTHLFVKRQHITEVTWDS